MSLPEPIVRSSIKRARGDHTSDLDREAKAVRWCTELREYEPEPEYEAALEAEAEADARNAWIFKGFPVNGEYGSANLKLIEERSIRSGSLGTNQLVQKVAELGAISRAVMREKMAVRHKNRAFEVAKANWSIASRKDAYLKARVVWEKCSESHLLWHL